MPGASLALFADLGACHVQKSSVTICVLPGALRVEGDIKGFRKKVIVYQISIHAFRMEGDVLMFCRLVSSILFLSTALRVEGDGLHVAPQRDIMA